MPFFTHIYAMNLGKQIYCIVTGVLLACFATVGCIETQRPSAEESLVHGVFSVVDRTEIDSIIRAYPTGYGKAASILQRHFDNLPPHQQAEWLVQISSPEDIADCIGSEDSALVKQLVEIYTSDNMLLKRFISRSSVKQHINNHVNP